MTQAAKWFDPVIGLDIHMVMVPAPPSPSPIPTALPHPFFGVVFDPLGAAIGAAVGMALGGGGPVLVNGMPAGNTGTDVLGYGHSPMPPGVSFAPNDIPGNEGVIVTGSKTVTFGGASEGRLLSMVMSCNFPVNLPTSMCLAIPAGPPVLIGGPDSFDAFSAVTRGIRTKWFSDALHKGLKPGPRLSKAICFLTGHPVDVMTGEVLSDAVDFEIPGPIPIKFERNYWSRSERDGALGPGWSHPFDMSVEEREFDVAVMLPDGRERVHPRMAEGSSIWDDIDRYTFERREDGYRLTTWDGLRYHFDRVPGAGRPYPLVRITDRCENQLTLRYEQGRLAAVTDTVGRELRFSNTPEGRLAGVHFDAMKLDLVRFEYDSEGMLSAAIDALGHALRYRYRGGVLVQETNRNGLSFYFEYDWYHPEGWCVRTWGDGGIYDRRITYDKLRHVTLVDDSRGGRTHYFGNAGGLVNRILDATGRETRYEWDASYRKTAEIDGLGGRTEWLYDERGNTIRERDPLGYARQWRYDNRCLATEMVDREGHRWIHDYDKRGKLSRIVDPLGQAHRVWHDQRGQIVEVVDPDGNSFKIQRDATANVAETVDWTGNSTSYEHDSLGRLIGRRESWGGRESWKWDDCGRVTAVQHADGSTVHLSYDPEGNISSVTDELGNTTRLVYAGNNRCVERVDPLGYRISYVYDTEELLCAIRNQRDEVHSIEYDLAGRVRKEKTFDGSSIEFRYDRSGREHEIVEASRRLTRIQRDARGAIIKRMLHDGKEVSFAYDGEARIVRARNRACEVVLLRDALGRIIEERSDGEWVKRHYGQRGSYVRQTSRHATTRYDFDPNGEPSAISVELRSDGVIAPQLVSVASWKRDGSGAEVERELLGALVTSWERDTSGRAVAIQTRRADDVVDSLRFAWSPIGSLREVEDSAFGKLELHHDRRSHLVSGRWADGITQHRAPDALGHLYRSPDRNDRTYGPGGRLLRSANAEYRYDDAGRVIEKAIKSAGKWQFSWDSEGQLREVKRPDGSRAAYVYDPFGRRIRKIINGEVTKFVWDQDELVHELRPGVPDVEWIFEPGSFRPLAKLEGAQCFGVLTDHVGAPRILLDDQANIAWRGRIDLYGDVHVDVERTNCPLRWPGQYEDDETGLYYNRFRYYDPEAGIYISRDPIGLLGGTSLYGYVDDPTSWIDPFGLSKCRAGKPRPPIPVGDPKAGWDHIFARHVPGYGITDGDLFRIPKGMSHDDIRKMLEEGIDEVWHSGARITTPHRKMQVFTKRLLIGELRAHYELVVDIPLNRIVTFYPALRPR